MPRLLSVALGLLFLLPVQVPAAGSATTPPDLPAGLDVAGMDPTVAPGDNFFLYTNGGWIAQAQIPADRSSTGTWASLFDRTEQRLADLIQRAATHEAPAGTEARLLGDYYRAFMDAGRIEALGLTPLDATRQEIAAIHDRRTLSQYLGSTLRADVDVLNSTQIYTSNVLGLWIAQDLEHPDRYVPFVLQGGLGMPDRGYYLDDSAKMVEIRAAYAAHIEQMLHLLGVPDASNRATQLIALERQIAAVHSTLEDTQDVQKGNNRWRRQDFSRQAPGIDWAVLWQAAHLPNTQQDFIVWQPTAVRGIAALVAQQSIETWKDCLLVHALERSSAVLPQSVGDAHFSFYGKALNGTPEQRPRWKRAIGSTDQALGDAAGKLYAQQYFSAEAKARVVAMVEHIRDAFKQRIDALEWMSAATKASAKAKLAVIRVGVGYPDAWRDYARLKISPDDAFGNLQRASLFEYRHQLAKLGKPVDRSEWVMEPQTVNAVNLPAMNALNFPAAALQPPFFDPNGDPAQNYGAIGTIIGHEISHSFDDEGAKFDQNGQLRNWWTADDLAHFKAAGDRLAAQFSAYRPFPDLAVNGRQTLSENIADVGGIAASLAAYHAEALQHSADIVAGFNGDQRFFLGFANNWRGKFREQSLRNQVLTNGHAPSEYRASTVRNIDAWYAAFAVKAGETLYLAPAERVPVW